MPHQNLMKLNGLDTDPTNNYLEVSLADDTSEVRGFGQPITSNMVKQMVNTYCNEYKDALKVIETIDKNEDGKYSDLKDSSEFKSLKSIFDVDKHIVSGIFGKELILQIIAQRNCEGIRYVIGKHEGKPTVILFGVQEDNEAKEATDIDGVKIKPSKPLKSFGDLTQQIEFLSSDPINGEVHKSSMTVSTIQRNKGLGFIDNIADVVLGSY